MFLEGHSVFFFTLFLKASAQHKGNTKTVVKEWEKKGEESIKASSENQSFSVNLNQSFLPQKHSCLICIGAHTYNLKK